MRHGPIGAALLCLLATGGAHAVESWPHLDRTSTGAERFTRDHPEWDGRGVVIAVVDSGVDIGVAGLRTTTSGQVKVVGARDFTGQGDIDLAAPDWRDGEAYHPDGWLLAGAAALGLTPGDEDVLLGAIEESQFTGSDVADLNGDGDAADRWAVLCRREERGWTVRVDLDGDGDLAEEDALGDYGDTHVAFSLPGDPLVPGQERTPLLLAPTILWRESVLSLHFDDGGHGTHVAGIAAGHAIGGVEGQDGVAPGAQVLSLKIGQNELPGGATVSGSMRKAFEYGARWSEEHGVPVVFNLSYGIASGLEGQAEMELFLNELLVKHPQLVVVTSAGNEGPGISSVGIPGAGQNVIAVGSYFTNELAKNLRGRDITTDRVVFYSSRGGEVDKPDVVAPGLAFSTIARWDDGPVKSGTSMASPEVAGACALLLSAAAAEGLQPTWGDVRRALWGSSKAVPGYGMLDQGYGLIDVPGAWGLLQRIVWEPGRPLSFDVVVDSPMPPGYSGRTAYWRAGGYVPDRRAGQRFSVTPVFAESVPADERVGVVVDLKLVSDVPWLHLDRSRIALQGEQEKIIGVRFDPAKLRKPGLYVGTVHAMPLDAPSPMFRLTAVVVVPERFDGPGPREKRFRGIKLEPGEVWRSYLEVPAGATAMEVRITVPGEEHGKFWVSLYDPIGETTYRRSGSADSEQGGEQVLRVDREMLHAGTWELCLIGAHDAVKSSRGDVRVRFFGLEADPLEIETIDGGASEPATAELTVINRFDQAFDGRAEGAIDRLQRTSEREADGDGWTTDFELTADRPRAEFRVEMDLPTYSQMTDVVLRVLDGDEPVASGGVGPRGGSVRVSGPGSYTFELIPGHGAIDPEEPIPFTFEERYYLADAAKVTVVTDDDDETARLGLYPGLPAPLKLQIDGTLPHTTDDFVAAGEVTFVDPDDDSEWLKLPIRVE